MFNNDLFLHSAGFLMGMLTLVMTIVGFKWSSTIKSFMFANQTLDVTKTSLAITSHWIWAIALFISPMIAYNWGILGLLWFIVPNALSVVTAGWIAKNIREKYPSGFSMTKYIENTFSKRTSWIYRILLLMAVLLAFTLSFIGINKFWGFTGLSSIINPVIVSGIIGIATLLFSMSGGIKTSIYTGSIQTILWLILTSILGYQVFTSDVSILSITGKNNLTSIFDPTFLTVFAITYLINSSVAALSHGMIYQKAFSLPKEKIMPTYWLSAGIFAVIIFLYGSAALWVFGSGLEIKTPDTSALSGIYSLLGVGGLMAFGILLLGQASTVIDSAMNYTASLVATDKYDMSEDAKTYSRIVMVVMLAVAWGIAWSGVDLWMIWVFAGILRAISGIPLIAQTITTKIKESTMFYATMIPLVPVLSLALYAKYIKSAPLEMYSAIAAVMVPLIIIIFQLVRDDFKSPPIINNRHESEFLR